MTRTSIAQVAGVVFGRRRERVNVETSAPRRDTSAGRPSAGRPGKARWRWARRLLVAVAAFAVTATLFSLIYNAATAGRAREPAGLRFVTADGIRTRYRQWGGGDGPPVVLVHGFAESADTFDPLGRALAGRRRVYALDLTGWGYSRREGPYDADHQAAQVLGFLDALRLDHVTLVGHSTGAAVVAAATLRSPDRISRLVFLDGDGLNTGAGAGATGLQTALPPPYRTTLLRLAVRSDWLIRRIYESNCGPGCPRLDRAGVDQWRRPLQVAGAEDGIWHMTSIVGLPATRVAALAGVPISKAVVFGSADDVFARSSPYETAKRIGAPAPVLIPGARHLSFISNPGQVASAITGGGG
ncbi:alpha/beta hydrolase [Actinoallomurus oryzae]|uniref:alpha/beta fold hydrolase n=1 Tax=Actinoallomurus oryzae TaxID=502180 RepID=UPI0031E600BB